VFAANSVGLIAVSQISRGLVERHGPRPLLRLGLILTAVGAVATLAVCVGRADVWLLLAALFIVMCAQGLVLPNGMAAAMASRSDALGSASGLIGLSQFGIGAAIAPLVGLGGTHDALPMGIVMVACAAVALAINLVFVRRRAGGLG